MIERIRKGPFAAVVQGVLVIVLLGSFVLITQQYSRSLYQIGFVLLVGSTFVQIVFGNLPPEADLKKSMRLLAIVFAIVLSVFVLGILLAPHLINLGR